MSHSRSSWSHTFTHSASRVLALITIFLTGGFAQDSILQKPAAKPADPVMGFESPKAWAVKTASPLTTVAGSTNRTQGALSFVLGSPSGTFTMSSAAVNSTSPALDNLDDTGSVFQLDLMPSAKVTGSLQLAVSSPSRGLRGAIAGTADLSKLRPGLFATVSFPIPDAIRRALVNATYSDLTFELAFQSSISGAATAPSMLFDNLRVSPVSLLTVKESVLKPADFGGSVSLQAVGGAPVKQSFDIGAVQVPETFRLTEGTADGTSVKLSLGNDGTAAYTCTYQPDLNDRTGQTYRLDACSNGAKAGDLVGASSAEFSIVGGTNQKLQAQLAQNPVGQMVGGDIIPPMPTYWGRADGCTPSSQSGAVSASCAAQVAEASQIVTGYFNQVSANNTAPNFIVAPVADRALRHADASFTADTNITSSQQNDFPFHREGHMNPGGDFDAYWRLNGDLNSKSDAATGNSSAHFDVDFSGHVVLFGDDVNVVSVNATIDTKSGTAPSATGSVHYFLFGQELPGGGTMNPSVGFNTSNSTIKSLPVFKQDYWIFTLDVEATATVTLKTTGTLAPTGLNVTVTPEVALGTHISGGVNILIASGSVDVKIQLLDVKAPVTAQAGVAINTNPATCALTFTFSLDGKVTISSLGGEIDLKATFGPCPFCDHETYTLLKWDPLFSTTQTLFHVGPLSAAAALPLPMCATVATASITSPGASVTVGMPVTLAGTITTTAGSGATACSDKLWTVSPAETITVSNGCQVSIVFNTPGAHTLTMKATTHFTDQFGRTSTASGAATRNVNAAPLSSGVHIMRITPDPAQGDAPYDNQQVTVLARSFPARIQLGGQFNGTATVKLTWTVTDSSGHSAVISTDPCSAPVCTQTGANQQTVNWAPAAAGVYGIRLSATDAVGKVVSSTSTVINLPKTQITF